MGEQLKKAIQALASGPERTNPTRVTREPGPTDSDALAPPTVPVPRWAEFVARILDDAITIPGTNIRFGLDGIIGMFLPGAGDAVTAIGSGALLLLAIQRRVPTSVLVRMLLNIALDVCAGAIPIVGDLFDFAYKSNRKNLELIQGEHTSTSTRGPLGDTLIFAVGALLLTLCIVLPLLVWYFLVRAIQG